jgi:hypothetical protein
MVNLYGLLAMLVGMNHLSMSFKVMYIQLTLNLEDTYQVIGLLLCIFFDRKCLNL